MAQLQVVDLSANTITGALPEQPFHPSARVIEFGAADNRLTGKVPLAFCQEPFTLSCRLEGNQFTKPASGQICAGKCTV
jgi:hypothetical protein